MTENELRIVLKKNGGWSMSKKPVKNSHYLYAVKKIAGSGGKRKEIYLCAVTSLEEKSEQDIIARLCSA